MSAAMRLDRALAAARRRVLADGGLLALPLVGAGVALGWRFGGTAAAAVVALLLLLLAAAVAWQVRRLRRYGRRWLVRRLDDRCPWLEDSTELLFATGAALGPLQQLQRSRLEQRLRSSEFPDLRPAWSLRRLALAWSAALLVVGLAQLWPESGARTAAAVQAQRSPGGAAATRLGQARLQVIPPAYTGLAASESSQLEARVPQGSELRWRLQIMPQPDAAELEFHDGSRIALAPGDDGWSATHTLAASTLYRIVAPGLPEQPLLRLEVVPDRPPTVRVLAPEQSLSLLAPGQRAWQLRFQAEDDYGVDARARLHLTLTEGLGENVSFSEQVLDLHGSGPPRERVFQASLDPVRLGLTEGGDLVARLEVRDNRQPQPQVTRSASVVLRWPPPEPPDIDGLDVMARDVLPAYFRSQRQIIIDAEALLAVRGSLAADVFLDRSDRLGVDQRLLRLRYGQFLGEEAEGGPAPPTFDADEPPAIALPIDDFGQEQPSSGADAHGDAASAGADDHDHGHGHDDGAPRDPQVFGSEAGMLEEYGHLHDLPEAATLLDPATRETLRRALREMWESELALRQGDPRRALPPANRALEYIKQVQQADRIYLGRVGSRLPPIDPGRRLGGDRKGMAGRSLPPAGVDVADDQDAAGGAWAALAPVPDGAAVDLDLLQAWVQRRQAHIDDPLALLAAIDALRRDPACEDCRRTLRGLLWRELPRPLPAAAGRVPADEIGRSYLDALEDLP